MFPAPLLQPVQTLSEQFVWHVLPVLFSPLSTSAPLFTCVQAFALSQGAIPICEVLELYAKTVDRLVKQPVQGPPDSWILLGHEGLAIVN